MIMYNLSPGYRSVVPPQDLCDDTAQTHILGPDGVLCGAKQDEHTLEYGRETCPHATDQLCPTCMEVGEDCDAFTDIADTTEEPL